MPAGWSHIYESKVTTAEEAVKAIKSGDRIFLTGNCSVPQVLLKALVQRAPELENVEICHALTIGASDYVAPEMEGHLRANALFIGPNVRKAVWEGRADFTPVLLSEFPLVFKKGILPVDVAFVHLSLPDEHGFCSYGIEAGLTKTAAESAKIIIAEVNPNMPRCLGDSFIHVSRIDYIVPVDYPLMELPMTTGGPSEIHVRIAEHIAELIPDGATMQMGIGEIPDAVLRFLRNKKDLGVHTELFSDGVIDLVEAGVITNARKTLHPGKIIAGFMLGTRRLYEWADDNPIIELRRTEYVNDPFVIAQNYRQVAINSAIEVDLTGQVCADSIGPKLYSGVGGQLDFIYGASRSEGGVPIIALPSTATFKDGTVVSRIVPMLKPGAGVVTTRYHVHYVVTEYGVAYLYGKSIRQRAQALIRIAHPDFRDELTRAAKELNYI
ncbi:MAG: acetyl-CoA hydrolase/transferase family protein [Thermoflexia bacterium]|nr:MAG: acetyl-CoA hydrolase/transferase family protein [Thermoflexia bacterium]